MDLASAPASARRIGPLYTVGLVVVLIADAVLAFALALLHANRYPNQNAVESIAYTVGYGGCSLLCPLLTLVGAAALLARLISKPFGTTLIKTLFWSGLTLVPMFLLLLAASALLRQH